MSAEQNKELVRRLMEEVFNQGNVSLVDELFAPDFVEHEELPPGIPPGREAVKQLPTIFGSAFPDFKVTIDDVIAEGDKVVVRSTWSGTHKGEFMGIAPTGKSVSFEVFDAIRIAGGKVVEHWGQMDNLRMMQQLGVIPAPGEGRE
jgi:predicted ester cyclase